MPETASVLRKQANWLLSLGDKLIKAGKLQLAAAEMIEESLDLTASGQVHAGTESGIYRYKRQYISATDAAEIALQDGEMGIAELYEKVTLMGARCKSELSLGAMMGQQRGKFSRSALKTWRLATKDGEGTILSEGEGQRNGAAT